MSTELYISSVFTKPLEPLHGPLRAGVSNSKHCAGRKRSFEAKKRCLRAAVKNIIDLVFVLEAFLVKFICEMFKSIQI